MLFTILIVIFIVTLFFLILAPATEYFSVFVISFVVLITCFVTLSLLPEPKEIDLGTVANYDYRVVDRYSAKVVLNFEVITADVVIHDVTELRRFTYENRWYSKQWGDDYKLFMTKEDFLASYGKNLDD